MIRPLRTLLAVVFLAFGAALGALNPIPVTVDLGLLRFEATLGVVMLGVLLMGVLLGGLAITVSVVLPMRHRRRRERKSVVQGAIPTELPVAIQTPAQTATAISAIRSTEPGGIEHGLHQ
jgi:lipopolysaccharide assembly protein A